MDPSLAGRNYRNRVLATEKEIGKALYKRTGQIRSIFWLPFIMHQLRPFEFRAGKLAISQHKAITITIPPAFANPTDGKPSYLAIRSAPYSGIVDQASVTQLREGTITEAQLLANLRDVFHFRDKGPDQIWTLPTGEVHYALMKYVPCIAYQCAPDSPVYAVTDGIVAHVGTVRIDPSGPPHYVVIIDTRVGYNVVFSYLSHVGVNKGQEVKSGDLIGLTGQPEQGVSVTVCCHLHQDGYAQQEDDIYSSIYVDPSILLPYLPTAKLSIPQEHIVIQEWLMSREQEAVQPRRLADLIQATATKIGVLSWQRYINQPYVVLPHNTTLANLSVAALILAGIALSLWRHLQRRIS